MIFQLKGLFPSAEVLVPTPEKLLQTAGSAGVVDQKAAGGLNVVAVACAVLTGKTREIKDNVIYWCTVKVKLQTAVCVLRSSINYNLTEKPRYGKESHRAAFMRVYKLLWAQLNAV